MYKNFLILCCSNVDYFKKIKIKMLFFHISFLVSCITGNEGRNSNEFGQQTNMLQSIKLTFLTCLPHQYKRKLKKTRPTISCGFNF